MYNSLMSTKQPHINLFSIISQISLKIKIVM